MRNSLKLWTASIAVGGLAIAGIGMAAPASASVSPAQPVVINEVYGGGGNSGGAYNRDFIELRNISANPVDITGWAVQYGSATGTLFSALTVLSGTIAPGATYVVAEGFGANLTLPELPAPDAAGTIAISGTTGKIALTSTSAPLICSSSTACTSSADVADLVGWGSSVVFADTVAPFTTNSTSIARSASGANTANNGADFTAGAPTPQSSTGDARPVRPTRSTRRSPRSRAPARVVAAGRHDGHAPTGSSRPPTRPAGSTATSSRRPAPAVRSTRPPGASDAIFVFSSATVGSVAIGDTRPGDRTPSASSTA